MPLEAPKLDLPHVLGGVAIIGSIASGGYSGVQSNDTKREMHRLEKTMLEQSKVVATQEQVVQRVQDLERRIAALAAVVEGLKR